MNFFLQGNLTENVYAVLSMTVGNLLERIQTNVTNVDAKVLRRVGVNTMRHIGICLKPLWFHGLIPCAIDGDV